ncbi:XRE family transcriptional regulator [uncultured Pontibacter sp.]|uniref:helix-turn-helix domain-containing protein n=1 Tax=uncultured Pontibacter sp. TaxID=453356 RepID=UPI0026341517|nr:XRE family transcriptional regulator [uncultured Pontibacter sp.]
MENFRERLKELAGKKGVTMKDIVTHIEMTENGFYKMIKNDTVRVDVLQKISNFLGVKPSYWFEDENSAPSQTATGIGNAVGDSNKSRVEIGGPKVGKSKYFPDDDLMYRLVVCEKEREVYKTERDSYARERDTYKTMVAQQAQLIERLSAR